MKIKIEWISDEVIGGEQEKHEVETIAGIDYRYPPEVERIIYRQIVEIAKLLIRYYQDKNE